MGSGSRAASGHPFARSRNINLLTLETYRYFPDNIAWFGFPGSLQGFLTQQRPAIFLEKAGLCALPSFVPCTRAFNVFFSPHRLTSVWVLESYYKSLQNNIQPS